MYFDRNVIHSYQNSPTTMKNLAPSKTAKILSIQHDFLSKNGYRLTLDRNDCEPLILKEFNIFDGVGNNVIRCRSYIQMELR